MSDMGDGNKDEECFERGNASRSLFICKVSFPRLVPSLIALKQCCCCCRTERHRHPCLPSLRLSIDSEGVSQRGKEGRGRNERQTDIVFLSAAVSDECALQGRVCRGVSSVYLSSHSLFLSLFLHPSIHLPSPCQHNNAATACGMMTAARAHCALLSRR